MTRPSLILLLLAAAFLLLIVPNASAGPRGSRPALVLPLFHSPPHPSKTFLIPPPRRYLGRSNSSAKMRLYDDLLRNGYYTTRLWIGTPPQRFALIVDTGSTVTYVPCSTCEQCGRHQDPKFQPDLSSTYQAVKCNADCNCDDERANCVYERQYAEMSTSSGVLGEDIMSFGNQSELEPQRAVFGCETLETGDLYSQHADGIMGLGRGDLSIVDQLVGKGAINDSFSLCYGGMEIGGGSMVLGAITHPSDMVFTDSDPERSPYYNIDLKGIQVAGKPVSVDASVFDGKHGTVLDSGTTYAYLPEEAFVAFKDAIIKELNSLKQIRGPDPNYNDVCFSGAGSDISQISNTFPEVDMVFGNGQKLVLSPENYLFRDACSKQSFSQEIRSFCLLGLLLIIKELNSLKQIRGPDPNYNDVCFSGAGSDISQISNTFPEVDMVFGNGQKLVLSPENYLFRHSKVPGAYCLGIFQNGRDPTTLLGGIVVRNTLVLYDRENSKIGFWKTNCSELGERLHMASALPPSPASSPSPEGNTSTNARPPTLPPTVQPSSAFPEKQQIGEITFKMSLSVNYSDLKPYTTELIQSFAQELGINTSQVHLLNVRDSGNDSFIEWAIVPSEPGAHFSNATAHSMIDKVAKHHMRLPEKFGKYNLIEWKIKPVSPRTWWQENYLRVVLAIAITLILMLSAYGIWYTLRRRQQTMSAYKPVGTAVPEQELQPL